MNGNVIVERKQGKKPLGKTKVSGGKKGKGGVARKKTVSIEKMLGRIPSPLLATFQKHAASSRTRANRVSGTSSMGAMAKDAKVYADSLVLPEIHLPVKLPDNSLQPSVVCHPEFEVPVPTAVHATTGTAGIAGFALAPNAGGTSQYWTVTAVGADNDTLTWAASAHPNASNFGVEFTDGRTVSQSVHMFDTNSDLNRTGEWFVGRIMSLEEFGTSVSPLPNKLSQFSQTPNVCTFPNNGKENGARSTFLPSGLSSQSAFVPSNSMTLEQGGWIICILKVPALGGTVTATGTNVIARCFQNLEFVPFQDNLELFDASVDIGSPSAVAASVASVAQILLQMGASLVSFEEFISSPGAKGFLTAGRWGWKILSSLWGTGASSGVGRYRRCRSGIRAFLLNADMALDGLNEDEVAVVRDCLRKADLALSLALLRVRSVESDRLDERRLRDSESYREESAVISLKAGLCHANIGDVTLSRLNQMTSETIPDEKKYDDFARAALMRWKEYPTNNSASVSTSSVSVQTQPPGGSELLPNTEINSRSSSAFSHLSLRSAGLR